MKRLLIPFSIGLICFAGCVTPSKPGAKLATDIPAEKSDPQYWMKQDAKFESTHADFDALWKSCEDALRTRRFRIARNDPRYGVLTTEPLISKQFFELWKHDVVTPGDLVDSSLKTIRRTVRVDFERTDDGTFHAKVKVLIEQLAEPERQVTHSGDFRETISGRRVLGTKESDEGTFLPLDYWFAIGRDGALEKSLAEAMNQK